MTLYIFYFILHFSLNFIPAQNLSCDLLNEPNYMFSDTFPDPLAAGWKGASVCELLKENERFRILKCTFPPGGGHDKHFHAPHFGYALSGSIFRIEDKNGIRELESKTGSHFTSDGVDWHKVLNIGDSTAVYLIFEPK